MKRKGHQTNIEIFKNNEDVVEEYAYDIYDDYIVKEVGSLFYKVNCIDLYLGTGELSERELGASVWNGEDIIYTTRKRINSDDGETLASFLAMVDREVERRVGDEDDYIEEAGRWADRLV